MTRRVMLTMLALVSALLVAAVAPLGLAAAGREQDSFRMGTVMSAQALAAVAEKWLGEHSASPTLVAALRHACPPGDEVWVFDPAVQMVVRLGGATQEKLPVPRSAITAALNRRGPAVSGRVDGELRVTVTMESILGGPAGALVLARPTGELDAHLRMLWSWLIAVAAVGLLMAAAVAVLLARWVGRPLSALDVAAQQLGDGALDTRSPTGHGPPEVRRLARTFNTMAGRLETLVHGHRAMMADVSHQLRTPLAALRLRLDLLSQDADHATASELAAAQGEIARLSRLVDGLLAIARAENVVAKAVEVAVDAVVQDRAAAWRPVAEERGVELTTACPGPVRASLGDGHLEQIVDNLLANALDVVPSGGNVKVSAAVTDQGARITVADDGPGMSQQQQEAAFRRFASTSPPGTGLGLAIVYRLVTSNGGTAALSDTPGGGLTVTLELPVLRASLCLVIEAAVRDMATRRRDHGFSAVPAASAGGRSSHSTGLRPGRAVPGRARPVRPGRRAAGAGSVCRRVRCGARRGPRSTLSRARGSTVPCTGHPRPRRRPCAFPGRAVAARGLLGERCAPVRARRRPLIAAVRPAGAPICGAGR